MCSQDWKPLVGSRPNNSFLLGLSSCCFLSSIFCPPWQGGKGRSRAWCSRALHTAQCNAGDRRGPQQMLVYGSINQFCFPIHITLRSRFGETISAQQHLSHGWRELCIWPDTGLPSGPHKLGPERASQDTWQRAHGKDVEGSRCTVRRHRSPGIASDSFVTVPL